MGPRLQASDIPVARERSAFPRHAVPAPPVRGRLPVPGRLGVAGRKRLPEVGRVVTAEECALTDRYHWTRRYRSPARTDAGRPGARRPPARRQPRRWRRGGAGARRVGQHPAGWRRRPEAGGPNRRPLGRMRLGSPGLRLGVRVGSSAPAAAAAAPHAAPHWHAGTHPSAAPCRLPVTVARLPPGARRCSGRVSSHGSEQSPCQ